MTQNAIPNTLLGIVSVYSPSGQEFEVVEYLVARMQALGYAQAFVDQAGNAVGLIGDGPRKIVLLGHIDTVPGEIPVRVDKNTLHGRGAVDAKGSLGAFVDAAIAVGPVPGWQFVVIGAVEEERDSIGARHIVSRYKPEFAIVGEPTRWNRIALGYKGSAWSKITIHRRMTHTAGPDEGACDAAIEVWDKLRAWVGIFNSGRERAFDRITLTLRGMNSGEDGFEEWASLRVGARLPTDFSPKEWYSELVQLAGNAVVEPVGYAVPAYRAEKNTPLVRAFLTGIRAGGGRPAFVFKTGTADLNIVAPIWDCPVVVYGPGDSALDHTPNEHIPLDEYARAVDILKHVLVKLTQGQVK